MDEWIEQEWANEWWLRHSFYPHLAHCLANGEKQRDMYVMHAMFQEKSYIRGTLPKLGLEEVFLKNENLGNE